MNLAKGVTDGLKLLGLLLAIAAVVWTVPEYTSLVK